MKESFETLVNVIVKNSDLAALKLVAGTMNFPVAEVIREAVHTKIESFKSDPEMRASVAGMIGQLYELIGEAPTPINTGVLPVPDERLSR